MGLQLPLFRSILSTDPAQKEEIMPAESDVLSVLEYDSEDADDCVCGMAQLEDEATSDEELPPTSGGLAVAEDEHRDNEDDVDGCELDFTAAEQTDDGELPAAIGGA
jgi:hypothetical protein